MQRPPILFVHGASCDARIWRLGFQQAFDEAGYPTEAMDLPGHGAHRVDLSQLHALGLKDYTDALCGVASTYATPPILIGHSMGAYLCQRYLIEGGLAKALVLLASVPPAGMGWEMLQFALRHPLSAAKLDWGRSEALDERWQRAQSILMTPMAPQALVQEVSSLLQAESLRAIQELGTEELADQPMPCPVFVGIGAEDALIRADTQGLTAQRYGVQPHLYKKMGHMLQVEPGYHNVVADILAFLAGFIQDQN